MQVTHAAAVLQRLGDGQATRLVIPTGLALDHVHAHSDHKPIADLLADLGDDLAQEAHAPVKGAAVVVVAPVGLGREEPLDHVVVVGVDLDTVESRALRLQRRESVLLHEPADLLACEGMRHQVDQRAAQGLRGAMRHAALDHQLGRGSRPGGMQARGIHAHPLQAVGPAPDAGAAGPHT